MTVKTERITILGTPDFKAFLTREAKKEGVSLSHLVRERCLRKPTNIEDEELLSMLVSQVVEATTRAKTEYSSANRTLIPRETGH